MQRVGVCVQTEIDNVLRSHASVGRKGVLARRTWWSKLVTSKFKLMEENDHPPLPQTAPPTHVAVGKPQTIIVGCDARDNSLGMALLQEISYDTR